MRLLIASDLHGAADRIALLRDKARRLQPDLLILLGDLLYHGPRNPLFSSYTPQAALDVLRHMDVPILAVRGNCDSEADRMLLPFDVPPSARLFVDGLNIIAVHGHHLPPNPPFPGVEEGNVLLSGHTHLPLAVTEGGIHHWNPGSTTLPKGGNPPSYAVWESGEFRVLTLLEDRLLLSHRPGAVMATQRIR